MLVNAHPIYGLAHNVTRVTVNLSYVAGYSPQPGEHKAAAVASLHLLDMQTRKDLSGPLVTFPPLSAYSYDNFTGYSPPLLASVANLSFPNAKPFLIALRIVNHDRNVQIPLHSLALTLEWGATATPGVVPAPVSKWLSPPADAAVVRRGPLLFALHPKEEFKMVKDYYEDVPTRPHAVDWEISTREPWAYALSLAADGERGVAAAASSAPTLSFDATPSSGWSVLRPFSTEEYPFSVRATAHKLPEEAWGYWAGSKITAQPPPSPVNASGRSSATPTTLRLVPFGGTNIRISVFPWASAAYM